MKVKALKKFENVIDSTIGKARTEGEEFEITEERFKQLDAFGGLVEVVEPEVKKAVKQPRTKKAIIKSE